MTTSSTIGPPADPWPPVNPAPPAGPGLPWSTIGPLADPGPPTAELPGVPSTRLGREDAPDDPRPPRPRQLKTRTVDDRMSLFGSMLGALGLVWIVLSYIEPVHSVLGFAICWYAAFIAMYAIVSTVNNPRTVVTDRVAAAVVTGGALAVGSSLLLTILFTGWKGWPALPHLNFVSTDMGGVRPQEALTRGGILHAIVGSLIEIAIAVAVTLPLGVGAAVYMTEVGGRLSRVVRTVVEAMTALPSIVAGLFIYTVLIVTLHVERTGFAASMAISVMMLPIIARAADVVLRIVPGGLREAGLALGSSQWRTVWHVVLPTARPGLATALILGVARGVGETSPVLLTSGASTFLNPNLAHNPVDQLFHDPMNSLPLFIYFAVRSGEPNYIIRGYGAAVVLLAIVLILFVTARRLARQKGGQR